jgi:capsular exopolysaccharide synthesis family protein
MSTFDVSLDPAVERTALPAPARERALLPAAIEQYRALARRIEERARHGAPRAMLVTSARAGEGRSTAASYAAVALAQRGRRVVIVDLDLRRPVLAARHGLPSSPGVGEIIRGEAPLASCLHDVDGAPGLTLLPAGPAEADPGPLLFAPGAKKLFEELRASFDYVVADGPPALGVSDAACLGDLLGGALLVARAARTTRRDLAAAAATLEGIAVLGAVLLGVDRRSCPEADRAEEVLSRRPTSIALARRI